MLSGQEKGNTSKVAESISSFRIGVELRSMLGTDGGLLRSQGEGASRNASGGGAAELIGLGTGGVSRLVAGVG